MDLRIVARTGGNLVDFAPYVPSIAGGAVAFQAGLAGGGSGVFVARGGAPAAIAVSDERFAGYVSHPDLAAGRCSVYARERSGRESCLLLEGGGALTVEDARVPLGGIGPLGPTMTTDGAVAFRAPLPAGGEGLFLGRPGAVVCVATTGDRFAGFEGLPLAGESGEVVFRAALPGGGAGVYRWRAGAIEAVIETGAAFLDLGRFPSIDFAGRIGVAAVRAGGVSVALVAGGARLEELELPGRLESVRGVLLARDGPPVLVATPPKGALTVYSGQQRVLGLGDTVAGSTVSGFALNPVSVDDDGSLAIRVELASGEQLILASA